MGKIRVVVVDDSALMRKIVSDMINAEEDMEVVAIARNGLELIEKIDLYKPEVITLDVEMPKLDGINTLKELKKLKINSKVIMLSSLTRSSSEVTLECLDLGAFDFVLKPSGSISLDISKVKEELIRKIRSSQKANAHTVNKSFNSIDKSRIYGENNSNGNVAKKETITTKKQLNNKINAVVIGASTGGPKALQTVLTAIKANLGVPVFVVQHMPIGFTKAFANRLNDYCNLRVLEADDGMEIREDTIYIAQGGSHMKVEKNRIVLSSENPIWGVRPAVDKLFISAAEIYKGNLLSVVLTGMGKDGANGTVEVKKMGGYTISQDEATSTIYGMPKATYETGMVDEVLPLDRIGTRIDELVRKSRIM
ncbi:protein-glutamate methylesterase/protein-glutamine glutaminase [Inconstantimicrobium mannanitabidum]|uniref:Chemotaxis response regulator protein-glutamate methylesterase n=1 Tax=Inconstantimicrobium mannanitabidum TaxID=1604901 RepID=A0ACB5R8U1_9CLOT|nr:chemotaxis response regulator protein-glutamate methylesterase [Clostridium sp. TW13]GKX65449.1 chemotaxis response regulator protein-glutamate methylesterase [Clostridium sp. TW13]